MPSAEPVHAQATLHMDEEQQQHHNLAGGEGKAQQVTGETREDWMQSRKQRSTDERDAEGERREKAHSRIRTIASGSVVW